MEVDFIQHYRKDGTILNEEISFPQLRLINHDGKAEGVVSREDALRKADEAGLDLIVVAPDANPPVCKIMDYSHYRYEKEKQLKQAKKGSRATVVKELKMSPNISEHDYQIRHKAAVKFLEKGHKVKINIVFRGREMSHMDLGTNLMNKVLEDLKDVAIAENTPKLAGRSMMALFSHK